MKLGTWQFAGLFAVAILGANHVSGEEWMRYFTYYGSWGTIGLVLTIIAITYISYKLVHTIYSLQIRSIAELFHLLFGPVLSPILTFLFYTISVGYCAFVIHEQVYQFQQITGMLPIVSLLLLLCILCLSVFLSIQHVSKASLVGIVFVILFLLFFFTKQQHIPFPSFAYQFNFWWLVRALFYTASHLMLSLVILIPLVARVSDLRVATRGIWLGGGFFALYALVSHLVLLAYWHDVNASSHPFAILSSNLIPGGSFVHVGLSSFFSVLFLAIWTESLAYKTAERFEMNKRPLQLLFAAAMVGISLIFALSFWVGLFTRMATVYFGLFFLLFMIRFLGRTPTK